MIRCTKCGNRMVRLVHASPLREYSCVACNHYVIFDYTIHSISDLERLGELEVINDDCYKF